MPKRSSKIEDPNLLAKDIFDVFLSKADPEAKAEPAVKNQAAVALGRLGGLKGGKARAEKLSPRKRKEIAKKAAEARWGKSKTQA